MPRLLELPQVIGIVGSRRRDTFDDYWACRKAFDLIYKPGDKIVSGGCEKGGDRFAELIAKELGITAIIHYAGKKHKNKAEFCRAAFGRNTLIAIDCTILIAVVAIDRTGGTEDTVKKVLARNKEVIYA